MQPEKTDNVLSDSDATNGKADQKSVDVKTNISEPITVIAKREKAEPKANFSKVSKKPKKDKPSHRDRHSDEVEVAKAWNDGGLIQEIESTTDTPLGASGFSPVEAGNYKYQFNEAVYNETGSSYKNLVGLMNFDELSKLSKVTNLKGYKFPKTKVLQNPVEIVNTSLLAKQYNDPTVYTNALHLPVYMSIMNYANYFNIEGHLPTNSLKLVTNGNEVDFTLTKHETSRKLVHFYSTTCNFVTDKKPTKYDIGWTTPNGQTFDTTTDPVKDFFKVTRTQVNGKEVITPNPTIWTQALALESGGTSLVNNSNLSPSLDMSINQNNYLISVAKVYNNIQNYVLSNYETKAHPWWSDADFVYTHIRNWVSFGTALYIMLDSLKGNLDAVKPIATKIGIIDDTIKYFLNQSNIQRKRLTARVTELANLAEKLPVNMEVIEAWNRSKKLAIHGDDLLDEDSLLVNKFFVLLSSESPDVNRPHILLKTSAAVPSMLVPIFNPLVKLLSTIKDPLEPVVNGFGPQKAFEFTKTGDGISDVANDRYTYNKQANDNTGKTFFTISYNRLTAGMFSILYDLENSQIITELVRGWVLTYAAFFEFFRNSKAFEGTQFSYLKPPYIDFTKYEDYSFGDIKVVANEVRPLALPTESSGNKNLSIPLIYPNLYNDNNIIHKLILNPENDIMHYDTRLKGIAVNEATEKNFSVGVNGDITSNANMTSIILTDTINIPFTPDRTIFAGNVNGVGLRSCRWNFTGGTNKSVWSVAMNFEWGKLTSHKRKIVNTKQLIRHSSNVAGGYYVTTQFWGAASKSYGGSSLVYLKNMEKFAPYNKLPYHIQAFSTQSGTPYLSISDPWGFGAQAQNYIQEYNAYWATEPFAEVNPRAIGSANGKVLTSDDVKLKW